MRAKSLFCLVLLCLLHYYASTQCGTNPTSGINTIASTNSVQNTYFAGTGNPTAGSNSLVVSSTAGLAAGDLVVIIQMQGTDINSANSSAYGGGGTTGTGYLTTNLYAGNYEYNSVASVSATTITLAYTLLNNYYTRTFSSGNAIQRYQIIRVPRNYDLSISSGASVTAPAWDGATGGVVVLEAANVMTINGTIDVSGKGFRGGGGKNYNPGVSAGNTNGTGVITNTDYRWNSTLTTAANRTGGAKGEGIAGTPYYVLTTGASTTGVSGTEGYVGGSVGRGAPANAGGGSTDGDPTNNQYNTGGGGGANGGAGGNGGSGWHPAGGNVSTFPTGGLGGSAFAERSLQRLIMGGGGGAGAANNSTTNEHHSSGASGGGIILLRAKSYAGAGSLLANGGSAINITTSGNTDAAGGGGAGGTIVVTTSQSGTVGLGGITASATGGKGGNMETHWDHGPGGGGGGGVIYSSGAFASTNVAGGSNGFTHTASTADPINNSYGSTPGINGLVVNLNRPAIFKSTGGVTGACGVLPITLLSFTASVKDAEVLLNWKTENAMNFQRFDIEYSENGTSFTKIGQLAYIATQEQYQFTDSRLGQDLYYRLKMVDADGSASYSFIIRVRKKEYNNLFALYPQPVNQYCVLEVTSIKAQAMSLQIIDGSGQIVRRETISIGSGQQTITLQNMGSLVPGIYVVRVTLDEAMHVAKLVIKH